MAKKAVVPRRSADPAIAGAVARLTPSDAPSTNGELYRKRTVLLAPDVHRRLRRYAVEHDVSESSIIEAALRHVFVDDGAKIGEIVHEYGASRRRSKAAI